MTHHHATVLDAVGTRLRAAEAALNMVDSPSGEGLLHLPMRRHLMAAVRADIKLAKQMLTLHKRHLGESHQLLQDQLRVLQQRADNTNIHPGLAPVPQESR